MYDERVGPLASIMDFLLEALRSTKAMPLVAKISYAAGLLGFLVFEFAVPSWLDGTAISAARVIALSALIAGSIVNARCSDDFFRRVYVNSCAIAFPASAITLYSLASFDVHLGRVTVGIVVLIWFASFVFAFAGLRRA